MNSTEKLMIASEKIEEATNLCRVAMDELAGITGREFFNTDSQIGAGETAIMDAIAFLIGTSIINKDKLS